MSKFIILGDCHVGARNASPILCEYQIKFFEDELFPYMEKHGINTILQLGDLFDSRKFSNHVILHTWKERVFDAMLDRGIKMVTLLGNHDIATRNTLDISSTELFLGAYDNIQIVKEVSHHILCGTEFLLVPWIVANDEPLVNKSIELSNALFCAGHFEFSGFEMQKGVESHGGIDPKPFDKFDMVFSGHYHTRSKKKNIQYTGVPYEMTWADYNDQKGFFVFDSTKQTSSFVKTRTNLFHRVEYDDSVDKPSCPKGVEGAYVKVVVVNKTDPHHFEKYLTGISLQSPADLKITEIENDFGDIDVDDALELEDTQTLIVSFIEQMDTDLNKDKLKSMMKALYIQASELVE